LVAEHGAWIKTEGNPWGLYKPLSSAWKESLRPILEIYADRLPGAFVEEKEYSLVWHYRMSDPEFASVRVTELIDHLTDFTANIDVQVISGSKVVEIRNAGISKANAAHEFLSRKAYDFVLAVGDDWTDEDLFKALPPHAYSIKVGHTLSNALYNVPDHRDVHSLLSEVSS
jgi:trehalose 6-phosphate synthase/phosphatase